jgi:hypothetical protein
MKLDVQYKRTLAKLRAGVIPLAVAILSASLALPAAASLGGDVNSVQADQAKMQATRRTLPVDERYTVHEITTPYGTVVREYVSPAGQVFGVTWRGPFLPDFQQIFGSYYQQFAAAAQTQRSAQPRRSRNAPLSVDQPGLVVHSGGHMRAYSGSAFVPGIIPQNVDPKEIQ